jgi:flagellar biosynthesis protein FlhF
MNLKSYEIEAIDENSIAPVVKNIESILYSQGLSAELANKIIDNASNYKNPSRNICDFLEKGLGGLIEIESRMHWKSHVVAFVGPTGVGKTTTIAKLAARIREAFSCKIGLISADYFRIGAGYQLQTYASLLHLPCKVLESSQDLSTQLFWAVNAFKDYDLIFIDTAGFSPRDQKRIFELDDTFSKLKNIEKVLLMPAPGNHKDLLSTANSFSQIGVDRTIITKLDESGYIGPVIEACMTINKPIGYFCFGQNVPEDIEPASIKRLAWRLCRTMH